VILWVALATILADRVAGLNVIVQFAYFAVAGLAWVAPIAWLMMWAVRGGLPGKAL
jgi:hypothetical protein